MAGNDEFAKKMDINCIKVKGDKQQVALFKDLFEEFGCLCEEKNVSNDGLGFAGVSEFITLVVGLMGGGGISAIITAIINNNNDKADKADDRVRIHFALDVFEIDCRKSSLNACKKVAIELAKELIRLRMCRNE